MNSGRNWLGVMFEALHYMAQIPGLRTNWSESIWRASKCGGWGRMEKTKWSEKVTNAEVLESIGDRRTLLNNVLHENSNGLGIF